MVTVFPFAATVPAKATMPPAGATTGERVGPAMSMPRC